MANPTTQGTLFIVATPIGNLADISARVIDTLHNADTIYCEDTRTSAKLLQHHGIATKTAAYHEHNAHTLRPKILQRLDEGAQLALISDAGTPLISDPGYKLVAEALDAGHRVIPIPGASALIVALSASGLPSDRFSFFGFLPTKGSARSDAIQQLSQLPTTLILYV